MPPSSGLRPRVDPRPGAPDAEADGGAPHPGPLLSLALGALGVVFGDIGTSPLYAVQTVFSIDDGAVSPNPADVYGVISLIFWSVTLIVTVKYVVFVLRADNDGEGGIMALAALVQTALSRTSARWGSVALVLGVLGAALFYGDSLITPAISVLSAIEGLEVAEPGLAHLVLPVGAAILTGLFVVQRFGTGHVGRLFGPVMLVWFATIAALGLPRIVARPGVLRGLSPTYIASFVVDHPYVAFVAMGAVVLAITGAEALYADVGHFGPRPIRLAWLAVAFPALIVNYLGQAALILDDPSTITNPFYLLAPGWARFPLVVLATLATVIASQAVISGAFSMSRQAVRLGYLPALTVRHTSRQSGQIYLPAVNWLLFVGVLVLVAYFRSSASLATAYGLAVTGTFLLTTTLFLTYAATVWHWARWKLVLAAVVVGGTELTYFGANLTKIASGGWLPLLIAALVVVVMTTWQRGRRIIGARRLAREGALPEFVERLNAASLTRVPGTAVFPHPTKETAPLALRTNVEFNHVLHERVIIVSIRPENVPHVPRADRLAVDELGCPDDGIVHVRARFGFHDDPDIPAVLRQAAGLTPELECDVDAASYYLSRITLEPSRERGMSRWRKRLFIAMSHYAANPAVAFNLPVDRTVVMGARVPL